LLLQASAFNRKHSGRRDPSSSNGSSDDADEADDVQSAKTLHKIDRLLHHFEAQEVELVEQRQKTILDLWSSPMLPVCVALYTCWFTNQIIGYGTSYNQSNFGSNLWLSSIMFELSSAAGCLVLLALIERIDRRRFARFAYSFLLFGCLALTVSFYFEGVARGSMIREIFPSDPIDPVRLVFGMLLKFMGTFAYHIIYLLSVETFPTIMRQLGVGTCSCASRIGSSLAPFSREFGLIVGLPGVFLVYGLFATTALIVIGFVPETRGKEIPNTLNECLQRRKEAKCKTNALVTFTKHPNPFLKSEINFFFI
jgi:OCT family organic cation transporter-like MFS transporter 4/5